MRDGQIDYERYGESDLLEIYGAMDRVRYPVNFENLKAKLRELGYEVRPSGDLVRMRPSSAAKAGEDGESQMRQNVASSWETRASLVLFGVAVVILLLGWYELKNGSGDSGPIAAVFVSMILASIVSAFGIWLAYRGSKTEAGSTPASNVAVFTSVFFAFGIGFFLLMLVGLFS